MLRLIQYFIKETLIAFYKQKDKFFVQKQVVKNNNILSNEEFEFNEEEFVKFVNTSFLENTQTYVSTIIDTFNQGIVDSCNHSKYKELGINIDNIKVLCINNNYSIFIGLYELNEFKKSVEKFKVDYIFSPYLLIDLKNKKTKNSIYILLTDTFCAIVMYENGTTPKYSNIHQLEEEKHIETIEDNLSIDDTIDDIDSDIDLIDDIEELDDLEDLDEPIEDIEEMDDIEKDKQELEETKNDIEILEFIKHSIKEYYENYSDNFLEKGYVFFTDEFSNSLKKHIEDEIFLTIQTEKIDILSLINQLALKEINV